MSNLPSVNSQSRFAVAGMVGGDDGKVHRNTEGDRSTPALRAAALLRPANLNGKLPALRRQVADLERQE